MCLCMLMHATMNHEGQQPTSAPATTAAVAGNGPLLARPDARTLLDERYARGEIERQEYVQKREDLSR
ncbi:MAG: SHOCT domain-containing protein [Actinobacteria bacterium]|nr:SHOCT domain-containing protein [Actinomycetota bacterium]